MSKKYRFFVKNAADVDINRIEREVDPASKAVLLVSKHNAAIGIRNEVLASFNNKDAIWFLQEVLQPTWGYKYLKAEDSCGGVVFQTGSGSQECIGFHWICVGLDRLDEVIPQLRKILADGPPSKRKVSVSVIA